MNSPAAEVPASPAIGHRACVARFRARRRRVDYYPGPAALQIIEAWRAKSLNNCIAGVIDDLILEGHKAMSGKVVGS